MLKSIFVNSQIQKIFSKFKGTIISLILGFLVSGLILLFMGGNPFVSFYKIFNTSLFNNLQKTLLSAAILTIASLAHVIAFKTGLFNIGVAGQMFFAGTISYIIGIRFFGNVNKFVGIIILFLIAMILGSLVAAISGFLKAFFNVHEVVSTILLNWAFFFLAKNFFSLIKTTWGTAKTLDLVPDISNSYNGYIFVGICLIFCVLIALFFWKTSFGFSLKITGLQKEVALVNGINIKLNTILSMSFSGLIAGFTGSCLFLISNRGIPYQYISGVLLPPEGFYSIAIALLAFSNALAIFPIALIFSALQEGSVILNIEERNISDLIVGTIIYFSAISILFQRLKVLDYLVLSYKYFHLEQRKQIILKRKKFISSKKLNIQKLKIQKNKLVKVKALKSEILASKKEFKKELVFLRKQYFKNRKLNLKEIQ